MRQTKTHSRINIHWHKRLNATWQLIVALMLFIVSMLASRGADIHPWEIEVFTFVYTLPDFLRPLFFVVTQAGSIHMFGGLLLLFLLFKRYNVVLRLLMTGLLAYLITGFAKDIWGRARPHDLLASVVNLDYVVRGPGFPSGHMALATAMALVVGHYLPRRFKWVVPVWVVGVGLSRMYLGIHAPLDIIGGFAIGWASYALLLHVRMSNVPLRRRKHRQKV